jgi:hypothetical protein
MNNTVYVVHCIDTEGPLHESIEATFARINAIFDLNLEPRVELLSRLQSGKVELGGLEGAVKKVVAPHLLAYNDTWDKIDAMLQEVMSDAFRCQLTDSQNQGWVYNWFCVDHVDYDSNPRRRDIGYHNIFDHYQAVLRELASEQDALHFHYHPHSFSRAAHHCATHWWATSDSLQRILSRRVVDRQWFPAANRPGFHVIRPDSHWFLEQYIPFDFSSQATATGGEDASQSGVETGRLGDWRRAPQTWTPYHPDHDDYQRPGRCRRWIARCLNVGTRYRLLTESDVRQAFEEARSGQSAVLGLTNHDFRNIKPDVNGARAILAKVSKEYPNVSFVFSEAIAAMRQSLNLVSQPPCELEVTLKTSGAGAHLLEVSSSTPTFGPQPWLALNTLAGTYHNDNFDIETPFHRWRYVLDEETFPLKSLHKIGVAANNAFGITTVVVLNCATGKFEKRHWNLPSV